MGVARVNGDLAVSRAFGDAQYKETGGPAQEDHPVSADPELLTACCDSSDFLVLVCDGISEGEFPNREVVALIAEELRKGKNSDPGAAAVSVCRKALDCGSKDNLSCMIVMFGPGEIPGAEKELIPGPMDEPSNVEFCNAYAAMAEHVGLSLAEAVELRYDISRKLVDASKPIATKTEDQVKTEDIGGESETEDQVNADAVKAAQAELSAFGDGPPPDSAQGSTERVKFFQDWIDKQRPPPGSGNQQQGRGRAGRGRGAKPRSKSNIMAILRQNPDLMAIAQAQNLIPSSESAEDPNGRTVQVAPVEEVRAAVEAHPSLHWDDKLVMVSSQRGTVLCDDASDSTSKVSFAPSKLVAWLPTSTLTNVEAALKDDDADVDTAAKRRRVDEKRLLEAPALKEDEAPSSAIVQ